MLNKTLSETSVILKYYYTSKEVFVHQIKHHNSACVRRHIRESWFNSLTFKAWQTEVSYCEYFNMLCTKIPFFIYWVTFNSEFYHDISILTKISTCIDGQTEFT